MVEVFDVELVVLFVLLFREEVKILDLNAAGRTTLQQTLARHFACETGIEILDLFINWFAFCFLFYLHFKNSWLHNRNINFNFVIRVWIVLHLSLQIQNVFLCLSQQVRCPRRRGVAKSELVTLIRLFGAQWHRLGLRDVFCKCLP